MRRSLSGGARGRALTDPDLTPARLEGGDGINCGGNRRYRASMLWEAFEVPAPALTWDGLAQDTESLFGKILRIDVDRGFPGYAIPRDNPFASGPGKKEIWAWGFRNPFRTTRSQQEQ